jgi:general secretion pathway protein C
MGALSDGLRRLLNQRLPSLLNVAALLLLTGSMAHWTWQFVPLPSIAVPQGAVADQANGTSYDLKGLLNAELFGKAAPAAVAPSSTTVAAIPTSSLDLTLTGVVAAGNESLALIRVNNEPETPFALGEQIAHGVTLKEVQADRAIIVRRGVVEALLLEEQTAGVGDLSGGAPQTAPAGNIVEPQGNNSYRVDRELVSQQMRDPDIFRQALIVPNAGGGFLVRQIKPGSIYEKLGLRVGDVIRKVNGRNVNSVDEALRLYQQLGGVDQLADVELEVLRAGRPEQLRYTVQ